MNNDSIALHEIKSTVAKGKDDFTFILDMLCNKENMGLLYDLVRACDSSSSLGVAIMDLINRLNQARDNALPEIDNFLNVIESSISGK